MKTNDRGTISLGTVTSNGFERSTGWNATENDGDVLFSEQSERQVASSSLPLGLGEYHLLADLPRLFRAYNLPPPSLDNSRSTGGTKRYCWSLRHNGALLSTFDDRFESNDARFFLANANGHRFVHLGRIQRNTEECFLESLLHRTFCDSSGNPILLLTFALELLATEVSFHELGSKKSKCKLREKVYMYGR